MPDESRRDRAGMVSGRFDAPRASITSGAIGSARNQSLSGIAPDWLPDGRPIGYLVRPFGGGSGGRVSRT